MDSNRDMSKTVTVPGELHSAATGNVVAAAEEIFDYKTNSYQSDLNRDSLSYNVSVHHPEKDFYTFDEAVRLVPEEFRVGGLKLTFNSDSSTIETYFYNGLDPEGFLDENNWGSSVGKYIDNPEYIHVTTDKDNKVIAGRTPDGAAFENVCFTTPKLSIDGHTVENTEDPEGRSEITTDSDDKVISYRDSEGVMHEDVGIESKSIFTNSLNLTDDGMSEFQQALKDAGFQPGGHGDWSDYLSNDGNNPLHISEPRCAMLNIISDFNLINLSKVSVGGTPGVNCEIPTQVEFWDGVGNYFKKWTLMSAQGNSSMAFPKKNIAFDFFDSNPDGDAFAVKFGNWVPQDSFHLKAYYCDIYRGFAAMGYKTFDLIQNSLHATENRPWKKALLTTAMKEANGSVSLPLVNDLSIQLDNEALCHPDLFPVIVYQNGEFFGVYSWQIKKHRDNYHQDKKSTENIHLDGLLSFDTIWAGSEVGIKWDQFEVRNPKDLIDINGNKYDGDFPTELIDENSPNYDATNKKHKNTAKVKKHINNLASRYLEINSGATVDEKKALFETYFDVSNIIDYDIFISIIGDEDGMSKNWQWTTYDGVKWFVNPYDLDMGLGNVFFGTYIQKITNYNLLGGTYNGPLAFVKQLYKQEVKDRWNYLISNNIISVDKMFNLLVDWTHRVGSDNYVKEFAKWPETPCNRDPEVNSNWETVSCVENLWDSTKSYSIGEYATVGLRGFKSIADNNIGHNPTTDDGTHWEDSTYDPNKQYQQNDICFDGQVSPFKFKCANENGCIGEKPITKIFTYFPQDMGYRDNIWRIYKALQVSFETLNTNINNL